MVDVIIFGSEFGGECVGGEESFGDAEGVGFAHFFGDAEHFELGFEGESVSGFDIESGDALGEEILGAFGGFIFELGFGSFAGGVNG